MADEAYHIGPAAAKDSYLRGDTILDIAKKTNAKAIHPGYGFLSENADFAEMCENEGVVFIGPPASAIRSMGDKDESKKIMEKANVPVVKGYSSKNQEPEYQIFAAEAAKIGYPVIVKAVKGGGGKGMQIVRRTEDIEASVKTANDLAKKYFKDGRVLVEKYLEEPRHIEVQIFGDNYGNIIYIAERDCSVQRRHQKVIEEAPAPGITPELRHKLGTTAVNAAKAVNYRGAGTVEFIMDTDKTFYFMEMNTRLQVEHPVTEAISGLDLVELQLKVASGWKLPIKQDQVKINGHAFEARIYAEDPYSNFAPRQGTITRLFVPSGKNVRVDTGVREGDVISADYDPMIAKLIVWDTDRATALQKLLDNLRRYIVLGFPTNITFLEKIANHPEFKAGEVTTKFIETYSSDLLTNKEITPPDEVISAVTLKLLLNEHNLSIKQASTQDPYSPWNYLLGFHTGTRVIIWKTEAENNIEVTVQYLSTNSFIIQQKTGQPMKVSGTITPEGQLHIQLDNKRLNNVKVLESDDTYRLFLNDSYYCLRLWNPLFKHEEHASGMVLASLAGQVKAVLCKPNQNVKKGDPLIIVTSMKMDSLINAPVSGLIKEVNVVSEQNIQKDDQLAFIEEEEKKKHVDSKSPKTAKH
eukprot:TRINITY_DN3692_c0_g1_i1.p1 TRINITY_DN3692_c0_g1~~TRINITY_DN3692_c0_g1_i1.p1  ORF type:complete len:735 (-),score=155.18 TRINITY_DN3692_c0_g1_i1:64-1980(-)